MASHQPVMLAQVLDALQAKPDAMIIDATFGRGGYSRALLNETGCRVMAIDRDPDAIAAGKDMVATYKGRFGIKHGLFSAMVELAHDEGLKGVDGVVFDLGLSSPQLDEAERGFSFRHDGPLDMRMGKSGSDATDFINSAQEDEIARVIWEFGEERASRRIARAIVKARNETPITRTKQLAAIIHSVMPPKKGQHPKRGQIDPATRSFQGLRIHINNELDEIEAALNGAEILLKPQGRLVAVSFHSLEDRIVKNFMVNRSGLSPRPSRHLPDVEPTKPDFGPSFALSRRKAIRPNDDEIKANPRSRSARLRLAIRTDAPAIIKEVA